MSCRLLILSCLVLSTLTFACDYINHEDEHDHTFDDDIFQRKLVKDINPGIYDAQSSAEVMCTTPHLNMAEMKNDYESFIKWKTQEIRNHRKNRKLVPIRIPTVFHVITNEKGVGKGAAKFVDQSIAQLNQAFAIAGMEFYLVAETAIIQNQTLYNLEYLNQHMPSGLRRGGSETLNIFTGWSKSSAGFASYPRYYVRSPESDGVYIKFLHMSPKSEMAGKLLPHEVGHWLDLFHTFGQTNITQGVGCDCVGDLVDDTPPQRTPSFGCPLRKDTCGGDDKLDPIFNFMDWSNCGEEFTKGQAERMIWAWKTFRSPHTDTGKVEIMLPDFASSSPPASPCQPGDSGSELIVELTTDRSTYDNLWEVRDSDNEIVTSAALFKARRTYTNGPYCLLPGDYKFTIFDTFGDGLDQTNQIFPAKYTVFLDGEVLVSGASFQCAESTTFTVSNSLPTPQEMTASPTQALTVFPTKGSTSSPSQASTTSQTQTPSDSQTQIPTSSPSQVLAPSHTQAPVTSQPQDLTVFPTQAPTSSPTQFPTMRTIFPAPGSIPPTTPGAPLSMGCASFPTTDNRKVYYIIAKHSNLALNVAGSSLRNGANILQWPVSSQLSKNDKWRLVPTNSDDDGYYSVVSELSGKALNVFQSMRAPGTNIIQWTLSEKNTNDDWCFVDRGDGYYAVINRLTGGVVEVVDGSMDAGANVQQGTDIGETYQSWQVLEYNPPKTTVSRLRVRSTNNQP